MRLTAPGGDSTVSYARGDRELPRFLVHPDERRHHNQRHGEPRSHCPHERLESEGPAGDREVDDANESGQLRRPLFGIIRLLLNPSSLTGLLLLRSRDE
jgi:hypothetical protein